MEELKHSILDFPDNPSDFDWKNEALLFYYYMMNIEDSNKKLIEGLFEEAKNKFFKIELMTQEEQRELFNKLKRELGVIKNIDNNFQRAIKFTVLILTAVNKLEGTLAEILSEKIRLEWELILNPEHKDLITEKLTELKERVEERVEKSFKTASNQAIRIVRTESWRYVNERRLEEFIKKGYTHKTTYPVKDERTGEDSWFYYDIHQIKPINEPFSYMWEGKQRVFMTPPDRPNDRNILIPHINPANI